MEASTFSAFPKRNSFLVLFFGGLVGTLGLLGLLPNGALQSRVLLPSRVFPRVSMKPQRPMSSSRFVSRWLNRPLSVEPGSEPSPTLMPTFDPEALQAVDLEGLSVRELKNELRVRGWALTGVKGDLVDRLQAALTWTEEDEPEEQEEPTFVTPRNPEHEQRIRERLNSFTILELRDEAMKFNVSLSARNKVNMIERIIRERSDEWIDMVIGPMEKKKLEEEQKRLTIEAEKEKARKLEEEKKEADLAREEERKARVEAKRHTITNFPGVLWREGPKKWEAITMHDGKQAFVGLFAEEKLAWEAVKKRRIRLNWPALDDPEPGDKYYLFPGVQWEDEESLWRAVAENREESVDIGMFSSRAEAWFELTKFRTERGWPRLSPTQMLPRQSSAENAEEPSSKENFDASKSVVSLRSQAPEKRQQVVASEIESSDQISKEDEANEEEGSLDAEPEAEIDWKAIAAESNLMVLTLSELKEECKKRGLAARGTKIELVERLEMHMRQPEESFDSPAKNALERLQKLSAVLEESVNFRFSFHDLPAPTEEELQANTTSDDPNIARLATLALSQTEGRVGKLPKTKNRKVEGLRNEAATGDLHALEEALDLDHDDVEKLRLMTKKQLRSIEKEKTKEKNENEPKHKGSLEPNINTPPFDWEKFYAEVGNLAEQNTTTPTTTTQSDFESGSLSELVGFLDLANTEDKSRAKTSSKGRSTSRTENEEDDEQVAAKALENLEFEDDDEHPIDNEVQAEWNKIRKDDGLETIPPPLPPAQRKLVDRLIMLFVSRDDTEWPELIRDSDIWRANADALFDRLKQRISKCKDKEDEWVLRVLDRELRKVHEQFLSNTGPFERVLTAAQLRRSAENWAREGPVQMTDKDEKLCDQLIFFFQERDPSEWFAVLRESKTWPAIAERFFYRLRFKERAERNPKSAQKLLEMRNILKEAHQQVFGVEAPDTISLEKDGADYRNIKDRDNKNVDDRTLYYWNKVIGGSKATREQYDDPM